VTNGLGIAAAVVVVLILAMALVIMWDRLVGRALIGVVAGATWVVAQSSGRWWFWPAAVVAVLAAIAAFVVAVLIS
jgi:hypothetical protein